MNYDPRPITIDQETEKTCVAFMGSCKRQAFPSDPVIIRIRRAGCPQHLLEYPAESGEKEGEVCFLWGDKLHSLEAGRYIGDIFENEIQIGRIQLQLHSSEWKATAIKPKEECSSDWICDREKPCDDL